ncbi:hypothetical protein [Shewanella sp. 10N.286.52.A9]|uniref:hypothetical protein n=1 Tax=Shewanella sp. 10N.286.52.A9 TaxID=3229711 RepID=UPI00354D28F3
MKKSVLALSVISALFLAGCNSDDDSSSPDPTPEPSPEIRTIEVSTALKNVSEMNALSSECLPVGESVKLNGDVNVPVGFEHPVCAIQDNKGNVHFVRTNDYQITVTDENGQKFQEEIGDITNFDFEFDVVGEANIAVNFVGELEGKYTDTYSYYTVETPSNGQTVNRSETEVLVAVDNEAYSFVTFQSHNDDILFDETTITTTKAFHFGLTAQENRTKNELIAYRYIKQDADLVFTARNYDTAFSSIDFEPKKHFDFGLLQIDPNTGGIIINPPKFGEPIVIIPTPTDRVVEPEQVTGAELQSYDPVTGAATFIATPVRGAAEPWIYPDFKISSGEFTLEQFDFSFNVETSLEASAMYMNIYLLDTDGESLNAVIYPNGEVTVKQKENGKYKEIQKFEGEGATASFIATFGGYPLESRIDGVKLQTNFIVRVADDNTEEFEFTIHDFTVEKIDLNPIEPVPGVVNEENLSNLTVESIDGDSGAVKAVVKKDDNAYVFAKTTGNTTLKEHSFDIDVTGFESGWMNIYLQTTDEAGKKVNSRFDYHMSGTYAGKFICDNSESYSCPTGGFESYNSFEDLVTAYGDYKVRKYMNGLLIGNFFLRNPAAIAGSEVTVNRFTVNP